MARTTTTLNGAVLATARSITVTSATGFATGNLVIVDEEVMVVTKEYVSGTSIPVLRGQDGTAMTAHATGTNVITELVTDAPNPASGGPPIIYDARPARVTVSYSAAGAIALPAAGTDGVAIINGTGALAMTLAVPTTDMDSCTLVIIGNGAAAHVVTVTGGLGAGGAALDVLTFAAGGRQSLMLMACNGVWVQVPSVLAGTLTNITITAT